MIATTNGQRLLIESGKSLGIVAKATQVSKGTVRNWKIGKSFPKDAQRAFMELEFGIPRESWDTPLPDGFEVKVPNAEPGGAPRADGTPAQRRTPKAVPSVSKSAEEKTETEAGPMTPPPPPSATKKRRSVPTKPTDEGPEKVEIPPYPDPPADDADAIDNIRYQLACIRHDLQWQALTHANRSKLRADEARAIKLAQEIERTKEMTEARFVKDHPAFKRHVTKIVAALEPFPEAMAAVIAALEGDKE